MKLIIQRNELLAPLQRVIGAVEKRQTMAMLANILINADSNQLSLTSTDLEITLKAYIEHSPKDPGIAAMPARKLFDICKALPDNCELQLEAHSDKAIIKAGRSRFSLACLPAEEFPSQEVGDIQTSFQLPIEVLRDLINRTAFAMANQDVRYYLNGLMLEVDKKYLRAVATDGHRLAYCETETDLGEQTPLQVIIPRKGVQELQKLLADVEGEVSIGLGSNHIQISTHAYEFTSKLIDGRFPDYHRVMPESADHHMLIERSLFKEALHRAAILSNEKYRGIRLSMGKDQLILQAHNSEQEEAEEELAVSYSGKPIEIGFNVQYLLDVANVIGSKQIDLALQDANSSVLLQDPEFLSASYVIMPMRL
jgi:DNA polymerase-3 subunit beta